MKNRCTKASVPGIEQRLDGGDINALRQFDTVKTGPGGFRRGRADPVTSEIIVQGPGAVDRHVNMVPFTVSLNTQRCLFFHGHNGSFLWLELVENAQGIWQGSGKEAGARNGEQLISYPANCLMTNFHFEATGTAHCESLAHGICRLPRHPAEIPRRGRATPFQQTTKSSFVKAPVAVLSCVVSFLQSGGHSLSRPSRSMHTTSVSVIPKP
jgi:hypothetical protein